MPSAESPNVTYNNLDTKQFDKTITVYHVVCECVKCNYMYRSICIIIIAMYLVLTYLLRDLTFIVWNGNFEGLGKNLTNQHLLHVH